MDAATSIETLGKMCTEAGGCTNCPLEKLSLECGGCIAAQIQAPERVLDILEEWAAVHPKLTKKQKFIEVFGIKPRLAGFQENHTRALGLPVEWWDAICNYGTYGAELGLLEIMGVLVPDGDVEGYLTADQVIEKYKAWKGV